MKFLLFTKIVGLVNIFHMRFFSVYRALPSYYTSIHSFFKLVAKYRETLGKEAQQQQQQHVQQQRQNIINSDSGSGSSSNSSITTFVPKRSNSSGDEEYEGKRKLISEMSEIIKQEPDVCVFYLESSEWRLQEALEMFASMTV